ncbi:MAG: cyclodeaminase/cyclohydrolase family protein [Roseiflexaceae bacterium]
MSDQAPNQGQLMQRNVAGFLDDLASGAPTPGGGSAAAVAGAMAAGLVSMVCNLSIGKKQFAEFEPEARAILEQSEHARAALQQLAEDDIQAFNRLMAAYRLPRATDADAATRKAAIQAATRVATEVPLRTAQVIAGLVPLLASLVRSGNRAAVSDVGAAALLIQSAVPAALLNVAINVPAFEDQRLAREFRQQAEELTAGLREATDGVLLLVQERLRS